MIQRIPINGAGVITLADGCGPQTVFISATQGAGAYTCDIVLPRSNELLANEFPNWTLPVNIATGLNPSIRIWNLNLAGELLYSIGGNASQPVRATPDFQWDGINWNLIGIR